VNAYVFGVLTLSSATFVARYFLPPNGIVRSSWLSSSKILLSSRDAFLFASLSAAVSSVFSASGVSAVASFAACVVGALFGAAGL